MCVWGGYLLLEKILTNKINYIYLWVVSIYTLKAVKVWSVEESILMNHPTRFVSSFLGSKHLPYNEVS